MGADTCSADRRCRRWSCEHCGPIRAGDEYRKFSANLSAYNGAVMLVSVTAPGADVLPWAGDRVNDSAGYCWNVTASKRLARMLKAAQASADRWLIRTYGFKRVRVVDKVTGEILVERSTFPRVVARAWAPQRRQVWHVHLALPAKTEVEKVWSRIVVGYMHAAQRRESAHLTANERRVMLDAERFFGVAPRGVYGWGFVDRKAAQKVRGSTGQTASYLARNVSRYMGSNVAEQTHLVGRRQRSHVSQRLTLATGVTIRNLRRVRRLYVVLRLGAELPEWPTAELETVWRLLLLGSIEPAAP